MMRPQNIRSRIAVRPVVVSKPKPQTPDTKPKASK